MDKIKNKMMLAEFSSIFQLVFASNSNNASPHKNLVDLEFTEANADMITVKLDPKEGKTENRYKLLISYPSNKIGQFKISINKYCTEKKQLTLFIEDFQLEKSFLLFIGKVDGKVFMMQMDQNWNGLSLAKLTERLFNPFSGKSSSDTLLDQHSEGVIMVSPGIFLADEHSLLLRSTCDSAMGMFIPNDKKCRYEAVIRSCRHGLSKYFVKGFQISVSALFSTFEIMPLHNENIYDISNRGYGFKNGTYSFFGKYYSHTLSLEFEECVEFNIAHMVRNDKFKQGHFFDHIFVRGKVRQSKSGSSTTCFTLTSWKRLCILEPSHNRWISQLHIQ